MALPGQTTLADVITTVRQRADMVNSTFVTDAELTGWIAASQQELYDLLIQKYGDNYYMANGTKPYTFVTDGTTDQYPLPDGSSTYKLSDGSTAAAFYKLLGVDLLQSGNQLYSLTIKPFQFAERNRWAWPNMQSLYGLVNLMYRINGNYLWLIPRAAGGQTIRLWYIPRLTPVASPTDVIDGVSGWEEYIVTDCCIKALAKEESDPTVFMSQKAALIARIEAAAENRDAGSPSRVSDSRGADFERPPGWGWGTF